MSYREYFVYGLTTTLVAGSGVSFTESNIRIDSDADFELHKLCYNATNGNVRVRMRDSSLGRYFIRDSSDLRAIASNFIGTPFITPRPVPILAGTNYIVELSDASGVANTVRFAFHGAKIRPGVSPWERKYRAVFPFPYGTQLQPVAASSTVSLRIEVDNDAHFLVDKITGHSQGSCTITIRESSRDRDWSNAALHFDTIVGNGQFPNILYANRFVARGSVISIQVQDLSAVANQIEVILWGRKLFE